MMLIRPGGWKKLASLLLLSLAAGCSGDLKEGAGKGDQVDVFALQVLPTLQAACTGSSCHSPGASGATYLAVSSSSSQTYQSVKRLVKAGNSSASALMVSMGTDYFTAAQRNAIASWIDAGANQYGDPASVAPPTVDLYVGSGKCIACHQGNSFIGGDKVFKYVNGRHVIHLSEVAASDTVCAKCHNPIGDSTSLEPLAARYDLNPTTFQPELKPAPSPDVAVVGCEACHGSGLKHNGKGATVYSQPGPAQCAGGGIETAGARCHVDLAADEIASSHVAYHPEGINIYAKYKAVGVKTYNPGHGAATETHNDARCPRCHTDQGARLYSDIVTVNMTVAGLAPSATTAFDAKYVFDATKLATAQAIALSPVFAVEEPPSATEEEMRVQMRVQCRTCHDAHEAGELLKPATVASSYTPGSVTASAEYNTCVLCHQDPAIFATSTAWDDGWKVSAGTSMQPDSTRVQQPKVLYHETSYNRLIAATHYDDPRTTNKIEGYVVRRTIAGVTNERACRDCHDVHSADLTIQKEWASSGHAGGMYNAKLAAIAAVPGSSSRTYQTGPYRVFTAGTFGSTYNSSYPDKPVKYAPVTYDAATGAGLIGLAGTTATPFDTLGTWAHYDWDATMKLSGTTLQSDRGQCQQCHTATGVKNFLNAQIAANPVTDVDLNGNIVRGNPGTFVYNFENNDYTHLAGWTKFVENTGDATKNKATVSSGQNEMLYCWGCHEDAFGRVRNPGPVKLLQFGSSTARGTTWTSSATIADLGLSNVCVGCHGGRGNNTKVVNEASSATPPSDNPTGGVKPGQTATKDHYLGAAATIDPANSKIGYMFYQAENNAKYFDVQSPHIGMVGAVRTVPYVLAKGPRDAKVKAGPCVTCHMGGKEGHSLDVALLDGTEIKNLTYCLNTVGCHNGTTAPTMSLAFKNAEKGRYENALLVLGAALNQATSGGAVYSADVYGYAVDDANSNKIADATESAYTNWGNLGLFGAAQNISYMDHEPGAFAHNNRYIKRIIFDSLEWMLDGSLDGTIAASKITALPTNIHTVLAGGGRKLYSEMDLAGAALWLDANKTTTDVIERP